MALGQVHALSVPTGHNLNGGQHPNKGKLKALHMPHITWICLLALLLPATPATDLRN